jgi:SIR2-like domain
MMRLASYVYPAERDVVFVLGAGASVADGAPIQWKLLPMIIEDPDETIRQSERGVQLHQFLSDNFAWDAAAEVFPSLEGVFGFLDYFMQRGENLSSFYTLDRLLYIRRTLVDAIHLLIGRSRGNTNGAYAQFWKQVARVNRNISVVSLNYDTLLEEAFDVIYQRFSLLDYSIHLMNYDQPQGMDAFEWWINPREPFQVDVGDDTVPIKLLKPHGSLNWKHCNSCNQVLLTPWNSLIDFDEGSLVRTVFYENSGCRQERYVCPLDGSPFESLILPPSHIKQLSHPVINQIFAEILREVHRARKLVFIGYSFPEADVHLRAIIKKAWRHGKEMVVIDPSQSATLHNNYRGISNDAQFIHQSFEELVCDDKMMEALLT